MALTIIQNPLTLQPAYNQVVFVVNSTNKNIKSFRYIFNIYDDDTNVLLTSLKVAPEPTNGYGYCDISKILSTEVTYDLFPSDYQYSAPKSYLKYRVEIGETYLYSWDFTSITYTPGDFYYTLIGATPTVWNLNNGIEIEITSGTDTWSQGLQIVLASPGNNLTVIGEYGGDASPVTVGGTVYWANRTKTTTLNIDSVDDLYVFNGVFSFADFRTYNDTTFIIPDVGADSTRRLLTDMPDEFYCTTEQDLCLNLFSKETNINTLRVRVANSNGDVFRTVVWNNSPDDDNVVQFAIGPNNFVSEVTVSGTLPVIKPTTEWYDFKIINALNTTLSKTYRVYIDRRCKIEDYEILFLDRLGSFVSYAFQLRSKETGTVERKDYNKFLGEITNIGWSYLSNDQGQSIYNINVNKLLELNTNWMTDEMSVYFEQLLTSPVTLIKMPDGLYYSCIVQDNGFEIMRQKNKNLLKKSVNVKLNNQMINI